MSFRSRIATLIALSGVCAASSLAQDSRQGLIQYPSISPDASHIVFSAAGDLWSIPSSGGVAERLTVHPGIEGQTRFSHDGSKIVFESSREGGQNLFTMDLVRDGDRIAPGSITPVTNSDRAMMLGGFSQDGSRVLFSAYLYREIYRHPRMYSAALDGGPMERVTDAFGRGPATHAETEDVYFIRGYYYPHRMAYRGPGNSDIFRYRPSDGSFTQLTQFDGNDFEPCILPDGSMVYISSRDGQYNLVRLAAGKTDQDQGAVRQLTHFKPDASNPETIALGVRDLQVSADGSTAVFVVWNTLYTLDLTNDRAKPVAVDVSLAEDLTRDRTYRKNISREVSEAAVHPSGKAVAEVARGELFIRSTSEDHPTIRVTDTPFRERDIAWSPDGTRLYFTADDGESLGNIYEVTVSLAREDLNPEPEPEEPEAEEESADDSDEGSEEAESAEGKASAEGEDEAGDEPVDDESSEETEEAAEEEEEEPKIDYAKRWSEALRFEISPVVESDTLVFHPMPSPDGTKLLYLRDRGDIVVRDLKSGDDRVIMELWSDPDVQWASDSRHLVVAAQDLDFNADVYIVDTQPGMDGEVPEPMNISRHPDIDHSPQLSHDGKVLTFLSDRDNENWEFDVYAVFLDRQLEGMAGYELDQYIKDAAAAAGKLKPIDPVSFDETGEGEEESDANEADEGLTFDADDAYLRVRRITSTPESESNLLLTPGADRIVFSTVIDGSRSYVSVDHRGRDRKSIKSGGVSDPRLSLNGKTLSYVSGGQAATTSPTGGKTTNLPIDATISIDRDRELAQKFHEASTRFGLYFYHPTMKGLNWDAISDRYRELVMQTRTQEAFTRLMNLMWGEVDGSHTGTWGGDGFSSGSPGNGYLGIDFTAVDNGYRVDAIIKGGPIDSMKNAPSVGDVIVAIGEQSLVGDDGQLKDLHTSMAHMSGDEVLIEYIPSESEDGASKLALVTPTSFGRMSRLRYDDEVMKRRAEVEELSNGRLGYLHIRGMGLAEVRDYERDLYAAAHGKEGLIIDVRDNGGGWTTDILLASLTAPNHAYTIPRGADPSTVEKDNYPRDRRLIYAYSRPINVLINQHSFSNAEIFAHSIRTANRGTLIGTQTFGGVISTGSFSLIDGTTVRRPFRGWYLPDGTDMENNGAKPDIDVPQTPTDEAAGRDAQLEAAVDELLGRLDG
ncbi:MAG: S41 family peptidase [Phycisphaerales bacterium]